MTMTLEALEARVTDLTEKIAQADARHTVTRVQYALLRMEDVDLCRGDLDGLDRDELRILCTDVDTVPLDMFHRSLDALIARNR